MTTLTVLPALAHQGRASVRVLPGAAIAATVVVVIAAVNPAVGSLIGGMGRREHRLAQRLPAAGTRAPWRDEVSRS